MALNVLDPTCILDIERSARHLATSVDEMTENLSGLLQGNHAGNLIISSRGDGEVVGLKNIVG